MIQTAIVKIWNKRIGAIAWNPSINLAAFEFDPDFEKNGLDLAPIKMPLYETRGRIFTFVETRSSQTFKGLPGLVADALPDKFGNALINSWLLRNGRPADSMNPVEMLCFIGKRGMGAIEFEPAVPKEINLSTRIELSSLIHISEQILFGKQNFETQLGENEEKGMMDILKIGTSAAGARAKAVIAYNEITGEVRSGQAKAPEGFGYWLLKFDGVQDRQFGASSGYGRVEMAYYMMAKEAGIHMMESRMLEENGRAHFMTRRFDRDPIKGKIHMQSFCGMMHYDFNDVGLYSYEQLFQTMRQLGLPYGDAEQLYKRMIFNVLARNCDDHTKNFAFLMDQSGVWKLSPAYDICHAYRPGSEWVSQHALTIRGKRTNISQEDLMEVGRQMNIKKAKNIYLVIEQSIKRWLEFADRTRVEPILADAIKQTLLV